MRVTAAQIPSRGRRGERAAGVDFLADGQGVVGCLGQQDEGEPEILALRVPDEKQAEMANPTRAAVML